MAQVEHDQCNPDAATETLSISHDQTSPSRSGLIILGNSGVGKSFLANLFLQEEKFVHQTSATAVTIKTEFVEYTNSNQTYVIFNIPGLVEADQERIESNKTEIDKAFEECPNAIVIYVFGTQKGRIRNEDVIAFKALNDAYPFDQKSLVLIVNGIPRQNRAPNYEGETIVLLKRMLQVELPSNICFLDDIDSNNSQEKDQLRRKLLQTIVNVVPTIHNKKQDIRLQADEINALQESLRKLTTEFEEKREELSMEFQKAQETHKEEIQVLQQKCNDLEQVKSGQENWALGLVKPVAKLHGWLTGVIGGWLTGEDPVRCGDEIMEAEGRFVEKFMK